LKTNFTSGSTFATLRAAMRNINKLFLLLVAPLVLAGCSTITNLTPSQQPRNASGLYPVEAKWDSRQQTIRPESFKPSVMVGLQSYPMRKTALMKNRWETLVPVPPDQNSINYRFKFDFEYNAIPQPMPDSKLSREYKLQIFDKPTAK
jgi:uncharacterized protein YceK